MITKTPKTDIYHESAIKYNDILAEAAEGAAEEMEDDTVKKWCLSVAKQHRFHSKQHQHALDRLIESTQKSSVIDNTKQEATN